MRLRLLLLGLCVTLVLPSAAAADGLPDPSFGTEGWWVEDVADGSGDQLEKSLVQPDGKIVAAGRVGVGGELEPLVVRLLPDGTPDPGFGDDGFARLDGGDTRDVLFGVALQADGKIVVAGQADSDLLVMRLLADGTPDSTWDDDGVATVPFGDDHWAWDVAVQGSKVLAAGGAYGVTGDPSDVAMTVVRLNADGSPDTSFSDDGIAVPLAPAGAEAQAKAVLVAGDRIVLGGSEADLLGANPRPRLVALTNAGELDTTFGTGGIATTAWGDRPALVNDVTLDGFGRLVAAGQRSPASGVLEATVARYTAGGELDSGFGTGGYRAIAIADRHAYLTSVTVSPGGRIHASGATSAMPPEDDLLGLWLLPDGAPDTTMGSDGHTVVARAADQSGYGGTLDAQGRMIITGYHYPANSMVLRLTGDTTAPDTAAEGAPSGLTRETSGTIAFSSGAIDLAGFECRVDGGAFSACSSPFAFGPLPDGPHSVEVRAVDIGGNPDASPARLSFTTDTTPPETTIAGAPSGPTNRATLALTLGASEPGSAFGCRVGSAAFAPCGASATFGPLPDGVHVIQARATDPVGHADPSPAQVTVTVDTKASKAVLPPRGVLRRRKPRLRVGCPAAEATGCRVALTLTARRGKRRVLARRTARIATGKSRRVTLRPTAAGKKAFRRKSLRVRARAVTTDGAGNTARSRRAAKLRRG